MSSRQSRPDPPLRPTLPAPPAALDVHTRPQLTARTLLGTAPIDALLRPAGLLDAGELLEALSGVSLALGGEEAAGGAVSRAGIEAHMSRRPA